MKNTFEVPNELILKWTKETYRDTAEIRIVDWETIVQKAAQWGADQELKACCDLIDGKYPSDKDYYPYDKIDGETLYRSRRPNRYSKKQQILGAFDELIKLYNIDNSLLSSVIRKAIENVDEEHFEE